jgi:hypothetical protein
MRLYIQRCSCSHGSSSIPRSKEAARKQQGSIKKQQEAARSSKKQQGSSKKKIFLSHPELGRGKNDGELVIIIVIIIIIIFFFFFFSFSFFSFFCIQISVCGDAMPPCSLFVRVSVSPSFLHVSVGSDCDGARFLIGGFLRCVQQAMEGGRKKNTAALLLLAIAIAMAMAMAMVKGQGALDCEDVTSNLEACAAYLTSGGTPTVECCQGVAALSGLASSRSARQSICQCLENAAQELQPLDSAVTALPSFCGVPFPYSFSRTQDCSR